MVITPTFCSWETTKMSLYNKLDLLGFSIALWLAYWISVPGEPRKRAPYRGLKKLDLPRLHLRFWMFQRFWRIDGTEDQTYQETAFPVEKEKVKCWLSTVLWAHFDWWHYLNAGEYSSRVHICATEYWQLVWTCTYFNPSKTSVKETPCEVSKISSPWLSCFTLTISKQTIRDLEDWRVSIYEWSPKCKQVWSKTMKKI